MAKIGLACVDSLAPVSTELDVGVWTSIGGTFSLAPQSTLFTLGTPGATAIRYAGDSSAVVLAWASVTVDPDEMGKLIAIQFFVEGVACGQTAQVSPPNTGSANMTLPGLLWVGASEEVELKVANLTDSTDVMIAHMTMLLMSIGG